MRCVFSRHVIPIRQHAAFNTFNQIRATGTNVETFASGVQCIPQRHGAMLTGHVDFEAALLGISGARNEHVLPKEWNHRAAKESNLTDVLAEHAGN